MTHDLDYLLRRADQEAVRTIAALHPAAAAAHRAMCHRYSVAALLRMRGPVQPRLG